ncbi:hypothetical protein QBC34DRAFT_322911 [Podospora aff. communis PSN243]|uniref:Ankyrin repeat protein n=1 Tax=Podospora aff. communis PSN243 TaxID=3040156 RepID=A0AAV9GQW9_9PEZI|nr:hypothetical protein QBC34DRAFT_322911 [Podospora aff. communis PSN243]
MESSTTKPFSQFLRPPTSRRPSHTSLAPSQRSTPWSARYHREAHDEQARRLASATAMHDAVKSASLAQLQSLLENNPDPDARDTKARTPLHTAAKFGRIPQLELLIERKDVDIDAVDMRKETPLHLAAMYDRVECVERLLRVGANTDIADERGHLPRYYASSEGVRRLFDSPPRVKGRGKRVVGGGPQNRILEETEVFYLATSASQPEGLQRVLCESFRGSFWEPDGESKWCSGSVWELVYGDDQEAVRRRAAGCKWFHLSAASEIWVKDLARNICAAKGYSSEKSRAMRDFIARVFRSVDAEGPVRKNHFVRERASERKMSEDEMYAVVLPIIDVDKRDYVQLARTHRTMALNQARQTGAVALDSLNIASADPFLGMHLTRMLQLSSFLDQSLPRSLDQSYHEYLDDDKIGALDSDQVLTRYISRLKAKSIELVRKPAEKRASIFGTASSDSIAKPTFRASSPDTSPVPSLQEREAANIDTSAQTDHQEQAAQVGDLFEENSTPEPDDLITVPHFWLFKFDQDTVITLYSERLDKTNEARFHDHVLNCVSDNRDLHDRAQDLSADLLAETILKSALSFEAKAFAKCVNPEAPEDFHDVELSFSKAYSNSIAEIYTEATERFDDLKNGLGSLSKDPNAFYCDVKEETKLLIRVDDNIGEIRMIKRILLNQATTFHRFRRAVFVDGASDGTLHRTREYRPTIIDTFEQLEAEAERVRSMAVTLLDLRQREAAIEDALSMGEQSTMLFIFTTVTVLFAPLSFVCGLLAMPIAGFPETWSALSLTEVFGLSTLGTVGLCVVMWGLYKIYQTIEVAQRNRERQPRHSSSPSAVLSSSGADKRVWGLFLPWKAGGGFRTRRQKAVQFKEAVEDAMPAAKPGEAGLRYRSVDIEKGVMGTSK